MNIRLLCLVPIIAAGFSFASEQRVEAACYLPNQRIAEKAAVTFLNDPSASLKEFPIGGGRMISKIRDLAASDPATLSPIAQLVPNAAPLQRSAIGSALGQAQRVCGTKDPAYAQRIEQAVHDIKDPVVMEAYQRVTGQLPIAPIGGGDGPDKQVLGGSEGGDAAAGVSEGSGMNSGGAHAEGSGKSEGGEVGVTEALAAGGGIRRVWQQYRGFPWSWAVRKW